MREREQQRERESKGWSQNVIHSQQQWCDGRTTCGNKCVYKISILLLFRSRKLTSVTTQTLRTVHQHILVVPNIYDKQHQRPDMKRNRHIRKIRRSTTYTQFNVIILKLSPYIENWKKNVLSDFFSLSLSFFSRFSFLYEFSSIQLLSSISIVVLQIRTHNERIILKIDVWWTRIKQSLGSPIHWKR